MDETTPLPEDELSDVKSDIDVNSSFPEKVETSTVESVVESSPLNTLLESTVDPNESEADHSPSPSKQKQASQSEDGLNCEPEIANVTEENNTAVSTDSVEECQRENLRIPSSKPDENGTTISTSPGGDDKKEAIPMPSPKQVTNDLDDNELVIDEPLEDVVKRDDAKKANPNGEEDEEVKADSSQDEPTKVEPAKESGDDTPPSSSVSSLEVSSSLTPHRPVKAGIRKPRAKSNVEMTPQMLEQLRVPFKHGWKREVVNRNVTDSGKKLQCDIYYFAPTGKKLRSMVEIEDWLKQNASGPVQYKHFSFARMALFEPPAEIVRDAGKPRNSLSLSKKALKTPPALPAKRQKAGLKLSTILPQLSGPLKRVVKKPAKAEEVSKVLEAKPPGQDLKLSETFVKRPQIKRTKITGHTFLKKRRLSPDWKPWGDEERVAPQKTVQPIAPRVPNQGTEEDELQSILGTPSKLISSIVNPEPPKPVKLATPPNLANSLVQVSGATIPSNVTVRIVRSSDATQGEILSQLGLTAKNVRMIGRQTDSNVVYLPAGQRPTRPPFSTISGVRYQTVNSSQPVPIIIASTINSSQPVPPVPLYIGPTISPSLSLSQPVASLNALPGSVLTSSVRPAAIPPPPPLAIRPRFQEVTSKVSLLSSHLPQPPKLQFAPTPSTMIPDPPPLQKAMSASALQAADSASTSSFSCNPQSRSLLLQKLAQKNEIRKPSPPPIMPRPVATNLLAPVMSLLSQSLSSHSESTPLSDAMAKSNAPTLVKALNCPVSNTYRNISTGADQFPSYVIGGMSRGSDIVGGSGIPGMQKLSEVRRPIDDSEKTVLVGLEMKQKNTEKNSKQVDGTVPATNSLPDESDQDFNLPISFGDPSSSSQCPNSSQLDCAPNSQQFHCVSISLNPKQLDLICPTSPSSSSNSVSSNGSSTECALEDHENVFIKLNASKFKDQDGKKPLKLILNGQELCLAPGLISAKSQDDDVNLKTTVGSLKDWLAKQSLKMKVSAGQKRRITVLPCLNKADYLRSFLLIQENYNIMMLIFKHLSIRDLLRACRVCRIWRRMALQKFLWRKLDLRGVSNIKWIPAVNFFMNVDVRTLIMPDPLLSVTDNLHTLDIIIDALSRMAQLKELRFGTVPQQMLDGFLEKMPHLKGIGAELITNAEPDIFSSKFVSTAPTEVGMAHGLDLVLSGCFTVGEAATVAGVAEADLLHMAQGSQPSALRLELHSVLLCCMRLCQMGFTVDQTVVENRLEDAAKKRPTSVKPPSHVQHLIALKLLGKNQHLLQVKLPYQPGDPKSRKLKAYISYLRSIYLDLDVHSSGSVLAFVMKEYQVLNAAGNRIQRVTALSVISPANLHLPVMLIFPNSVTNYSEGYPGLIFITSKEGAMTSQLLTHYLRAVFDYISVRPVVIFFDGHEQFLSQELVSECVNKSVVLHCIPKELGHTLFPGKYGGILNSLENGIGNNLVPEKAFIDLISLHLNKEWFMNWQGMCRAFQITGTFPLNATAALDLYRSTASGDNDEEEDGDEDEDEDDVSGSRMDESDSEVDDKDSSEIILSSSDDEEENENQNGNETQLTNEQQIDLTEDQEEAENACEVGKDDGGLLKENQRILLCESQRNIKKGSEVAAGLVYALKGNSKSDQTKDQFGKERFDNAAFSLTKPSKPDPIQDQEAGKALEAKPCHLYVPKRNVQDHNKIVSDRDRKFLDDDDNDKKQLAGKDEEDVGNGEHMDVSDEGINEEGNSSKDVDSVSEDDDGDDIAGGTKRLFIHISEDRKEDKDESESPPKKKRKFQESRQNMKRSSLESIIETIDAVIASSRDYDDSIATPGKVPSAASAGKEKNVLSKPPLKMKLSSKGVKGMISILSADEKSGQSAKGSVESNGDRSDNFEAASNDPQSEEEESEVEGSDEDMEEEDEDAVDVSEKEIEEEEDDERDEDDNDDEEDEMMDEVKSNVDDKVDQAEEESLEAESELDAGAVQSDHGSPEVNENAESSKKRKKKKKKRKKKKSAVEREGGGLGVNGQDSSPEVKSSRRRKKKKRRRELSDKNVSAVKEVDEKSGNGEGLTESKDSEKTEMLMRRISLADHDYDAKFDSDSGHELVEENTPNAQAGTGATDALTISSDQGALGESGQELGKSSLEEENKNSSSQSSSTDSDSSQDSDSSSSSSGSGSSDSSSSSGEESDSDSSNSDEEEDESDDSATPAKTENSVPANGKDEDGSENESSSEEQNDSDNDNDDDEEEEGNESEEDESGDGEGDSQEALYSEDDEDSGEDDDSKCQLCMASNPPHSNDQIIDWVDCHRNCGRWFHIICIQRSQSKGNPKRFVCPSCRCKR